MAKYYWDTSLKYDPRENRTSISIFKTLPPNKHTEMKEYQTPLKGHGRPNASKLSNRLSKKTIPKKNLNAAFSSISEDVSDKLSVMESTPISVISELNEVNRESEISESLMILPDSALSSSAPSSGHASWNVAKSSEFDGSKFGSMEAEVIAGFLRQARTQVLDCAGLDAESKKILDALVEIVVQDFHAVRE